MIIETLKSLSGHITLIYPHISEDAPLQEIVAAPRIEIIDTQDGTPIAARLNAHYDGMSAREIRELRDALGVVLEAMGEGTAER